MSMIFKPWLFLALGILFAVLIPACSDTNECVERERDAEDVFEDVGDEIESRCEKIEDELEAEGDRLEREFERRYD